MSKTYIRELSTYKRIIYYPELYYVYELPGELVVDVQKFVEQEQIRHLSNLKILSLFFDHILLIPDQFVIFANEHTKALVIKLFGDKDIQTLIEAGIIITSISDRNRDIHDYFEDTLARISDLKGIKPLCKLPVVENSIGKLDVFSREVNQQTVFWAEKMFHVLDLNTDVLGDFIGQSRDLVQRSGYKDVLPYTFEGFIFRLKLSLLPDNLKMLLWKVGSKLYLEAGTFGNPGSVRYPLIHIEGDLAVGELKLGDVLGFLYSPRFLSLFLVAIGVDYKEVSKLFSLSAPRILIIKEKKFWIPFKENYFNFCKRLSSDLKDIESLIGGKKEGAHIVRQHLLFGATKGSSNIVPSMAESVVKVLSKYYSLILPKIVEKTLAEYIGDCILDIKSPYFLDFREALSTELNVIH